MESHLNKEKLDTIKRYVHNWFVDNKMIDIVEKTYRRMSDGSLQLSFCGHSIKYENLELYKRSNIEQLLHNSFYRSHMVEILRMNVSRQEALDFMLLLFTTKLLIKMMSQELLTLLP